MTVARTRPLRRLSAKGFSLFETLVVFVLLSLLSTLLLQGMGVFADRYDTVQRVHRTATFTSLRQHWFVTSVRGLVPVGLFAHRFQGNPNSFHGTTLRPLATEPGVPVRMRWRVEDEGLAVTYAEDDAPAWQIGAFERGPVAFEYADSRGEWHRHWPPESAADEWVPRLIRLAAEDDRTIWLASVEASPRPRFDESVLSMQ